MSTVYGPVSSWRFGRSLGIDVLLPPKKCTFNCIYCQLGTTKTPIRRLEELHESPIEAKRVIDDLDRVTSQLDMNSIDVVTISGTGEPALNLELGEIATRVKERIGHLPLIILTNSSLLGRKDVRKNLSRFDWIVAKLDVGDDETLRLINRPADKEMRVETILASLRKLKREVDAHLALEVMLLHSEDSQITNVKGTPFRNLTKAILNLEPDQVQLEIPYRPPSESFVKQPSRKQLELIFSELSRTLGEDRLWVYSLHDQRGKIVTWRYTGSPERRIIELLKRRPCSAVDISKSLGIDLSITSELLNKMTEGGKVAMKISDDEQYYSYKENPLTGD